MYLGIYSINDTIHFRANTATQQGSSIDATVGPTFQVFTNAGTTAISTGTMTKVGAETGYYEAAFAATSASYTDGQYFILIRATVDGQTPSGQLSFQLVSDGTSLEETFQDIELIAAAVPVIGSGTISIDHNFGGTDSFRVTASGTPLADVDIRAFVRTDYDAGLRANKHIVGQTRTSTDGRWGNVIRLDAGNYVLEFSKPGQYRTSTVNVAVSAAAAAAASVMSMSVESMSMESMPVGMSLTADYSAPEAAITVAVPSNVYVDHNYKGIDSLRIVSKEKPIAGVDIKIFNKNDYDAGRITEEYIVQRTVTDKNGRWERSLMLQPGRGYVVEFSKKGKFSTSVKVIQL